MRRLRNTLALGTGETPASFASRLAALNGLSARELCLDMGTQFQKVVDGDPQALAVIAHKSNTDAAALKENAFVKTGERRYTHRGEDLTRDNLRRATVVVCPMCLSEDIAAAPRSRPHIVVHQRASWQIAALKTCPIHSMPLFVVDKDMTPKTMHDWSHHVGKILPDLPRLVAETGRRHLSSFETYVVNRTNGGPVRSGLIDSFPLYVAIMACELFGAVANLGRTANLKTLTDEEWRLAGAAGFRIFDDGKPGVEVFLQGLQTSYPYSRAGSEGPQATFGRIYQSLEFGRADSAFDPLRDLVGNFIRKAFPVGPGDVVFSTPVETRRLHSIRTLSLETGLHPKRLRKLLSSAGMLPSNANQLADGNCLFDAQPAVSLAQAAAAATLSVRDAGDYINAPRVQRDMLYRFGIIVPRIKALEHGAADLFAPEDLDDFLARLLAGAPRIPSAVPNRVDIPTAAKKACCGSVEIVQAILDGRLAPKAYLATERGYMAVLVDVEEVRALFRGADFDGVTGQALADRLHVADKVAHNLIAGGHLPTVTEINPVNRCPSVIVPTAEIERFEREFTSLFALAEQKGRHFRGLKKELQAAGVKPAFDPEMIGATFYRRSDVIAEGKRTVKQLGKGNPR